ncbi:tyrosine-type recombinase/integrase [Candidatus Microgenomates bacterium]|nr:tyrosine-type recombinase/integrase [Candidatus Microgenomates bacterium]
MPISLNLSDSPQKFIDYLKKSGRAHATILAYGKDIDQLVESALQKQRKSVDEITKNDIDEFLSQLSKEGYTLKSVSRKLNSIKTFFKFLKANDFIDFNPTQEIPHPKYETKPPRVLTKIEYRALRDACRQDTRTSAIVELFLQTGLRISELANMELSDIKDAELFIASQGKKNGRAVPLNKAAKDALEKYLQKRPTSDDKKVFITKTGRPFLIRNIRTVIDRYFKLAGISDAKVNDLRHTFVVHHLANGVPLTTISKIVGHKRLSTTEKYLDLVNETIKEVGRLGEL